MSGWAVGWLVCAGLAFVFACAVNGEDGAGPIFFVVGCLLGAAFAVEMDKGKYYPELCQLRLDATADTLALVQEYPSCLEYTEVQP